MATKNYGYDMDVVLHCYAATNTIEYLQDTIETLYCELPNATEQTKTKVKNARKLYYDTVKMLGMLRDKADDKVMQTIRRQLEQQS